MMTQLFGTHLCSLIVDLEGSEKRRTGPEYRQRLPKDPNYAAKVEMARQMSPGDKMGLGLRLYDLKCKFERELIRAQYPTFTEQQVEAEFGYRVALARAISDEGIYQDCGILEE